VKKLFIFLVLVVAVILLFAKMEITPEQKEVSKEIPHEEFK